MAEPARHPGERGKSPVERRADIERIRRAIEDAAAMSGRPAPVPRTQEERLHRLIAARTAKVAAIQVRVEHARREVERLEEEAATLVDEIAGYERGLQALLGGVLAEAGGWAATHWSPAPVLGYRMWVRRNGRLNGARTAWEGPVLEAECLGRARPGRPAPGVPHTGGECGAPPCGIYALAGCGGLVPRLMLPGRALGMVALSGKVVEHERGFRGQIARVVALAVNAAGAIHCSADPLWIEGVFAGADPAVMPGAVRRLPIRPRPETAVEAFFEDERVRYDQSWTSESRSE